MTDPTTVRVRDDGAALTITVDGPVDLATAAGVEADITAAIGNRAATVTLDLTAVDYLDSAGVRIVFALAARLAELRTTLHVQAPPGSISRRVLELSGYAAMGDLRP